MAARATQREADRIPLSRERVLHAAIGLSDASGLQSLTMRRLAQELGVEAMTLYYYVANKDEILKGIVEIVVGEIELPPVTLDWKSAIRRTAHSAYEILLRHRWAASQILRAGDTPARFRYMDALLGTFRSAGFSASQTDHAYHAIESHIMGFVLWEVGMDLGTREELAAMATDVLNALPADEYPHLVEHIHQHLKPRDPEDPGEFAFGLELILDGFERIRDAA